MALGKLSLPLVFCALFLASYVLLLGGFTRKVTIVPNLDHVVASYLKNTVTPMPHPHRSRMLNTVKKSYAAFQSLTVNGIKRAVDITQNRARITDYHMPPTEPGWSKTSKDNGEPLNIVLFYADDWTLRVLGALNKYVKTPHIDALAKDGMLFPYNSVTTSICWISRGTLATGTYAAIHKQLMPSSDGAFENERFHWNNTLFPLLKANGYYSGHVGKWHAPQPRKHMKNAFDVFSAYYGYHWMERDGKKRHVTDLNGEDALNFLKHRPKDKKFALTVAFFATHAVDGQIPPYEPMDESKALYENVTLPPVRTNTEEHFKALPEFLHTANEGRNRYINRFDTPENYQKNLKDLYRMASEVDAVVGSVVDELKAQGVYEKSLVVFTTDNGNMHGEHGLSEKWFPFEESIRVPLVVRDPRMPKSERGKVNNEFTLNVDLAPTILSAAQIPVPEFMQGRDMSEIYLDPEQATKSWRQDFFYEWNVGEPVNAKGSWQKIGIEPVFALVRKDWKYFFWPNHNYEQLYHIETDADEEFDVRSSNATTTVKALEFMRERYRFMKDYAQNGNPV